jgi:hypothetical protein
MESRIFKFYCVNLARNFKSNKIVKHFITQNKFIMKSLFLTLALVVSAAASLFAQSDLVVFSENGDRFYLVVNGVRYNSTPETNVRVQDLNQPTAKIKAIFEDTKLGEVNATGYPQPGMETLLMIKLNKKGEYKMAYQGEAPINRLPNQVVVYPNMPAVAAPAPAVVQQQTVVAPGAVVQQTTTTTTVNGVGMGTGINMGMSVPDGEGGNISVGINVGGMIPGTNVTYTETTTTTVNTNTNVVSAPVYQQPQPVAQPVNTCMPMSANDFNNAKNSIGSKDFEETKLTVAKQIAKTTCLTATQIRDIVMLFDFEQSKLEFAKFAYPGCFDKQNYYIINDSFDFESSVEELTRAIGQ